MPIASLIQRLVVKRKDVGSSTIRLSRRRALASP